MTKEVELKFLVDDFGFVRRKLKKLGAKLKWKGREENWLFDAKDKRFLKKDSVLRIKKMGDIRLTLKEGKHLEREVKVSDEYQVTISDYPVMKKILHKLGFNEVYSYSKNREHWKLRDAYVELDTLNSKKFVEIEAPHARLKLLAKKLGLDFTRSTTKSYTKILKEK